jgi:hypothetical protein
MSDGSKGKKFGRHSERDASMSRYRASNRRALNAAKRAAKQAKFQAKKNAKKATMTPHGTSRALRRADMTIFNAVRHVKQEAARKAASRT